MASNYRGKVPRQVGDWHGKGEVGGDKDRRVAIDNDANMYNRYAESKQKATPRLSDKDLKRVEEITTSPDESAVYTKVKARYE
jgi:hypothetical protein